MLVGDEIKRIRIERGLTQQELADMCNINRSYISHIEAHRREPKLETVSLLLNSMGFEIKIVRKRLNEKATSQINE